MKSGCFFISMDREKMNKINGFTPESYIWFQFIAGGMAGMLGTFILPTKMPDSLTSLVLYFILLYVSMLLGVVLVGYFQFKSLNRLNRFRNAIVECFVGLIMFVMVYFLIDWLFLDRNWQSLSILVPLIGAIIGLNFIFIRAKKQSDLTN